MDLAVPFVALFYASQFSDSLEFNKEYIDVGFSMKHLNMLNARQEKLLKPITGDFYKEVDSKGNKALAQIMIDDNLFNSLFSVILSIDKMYSLRELAKGNIKFKPFLDGLTTSAVGALLPEFIEQYGHAKKIDLVFTPSHEFFKDGFPDAK
jgi:hypothetical protein